MTIYFGGFPLSEDTMPVTPGLGIWDPSGLTSSPAPDTQQAASLSPGEWAANTLAGLGMVGAPGFGTIAGLGNIANNFDRTGGQMVGSPAFANFFNDVVDFLSGTNFGAIGVGGTPAAADIQGPASPYSGVSDPNTNAGSYGTSAPDGYGGSISSSDQNGAGEAGVGLAHGGLVRGPGGPMDDAIAARLSNGEYVIPAHAVAKYGSNTLAQLAHEKVSRNALAGMRRR